MAIQWSLLLFTLTAGTGAGLMTCAGLGEFIGASKKTRFIAAIVALILLVVGGIFSIFHLGQPGAVMAAATNLMSFSPISLELIFLGLCALVTLIYIFVVNREGSASKIVGVIGVVGGIIFMYVSGHGYEVIASRPAWATPSLSLSYLLTSLTVAGFVFLLLQTLFKDEAAAVKKTALIVLLVAALATVALLIYALMAPLGDYAIWLWICSVGTGGLAVVVCAFLVFAKDMKLMIYVGLVLAIAGAVVFRAVMWLAAAPYVPNLFDIAANNRGLFPF